jgi:hypothetical protein
MEYPDFITWSLNIGLTRAQAANLFAAGYAGPSGYTWATKPAASAVLTGTTIRISDVGVSGSLWTSDGTNWRPQNGSLVLWRRVGSLAAPVAPNLTPTGANLSFAVPDTMNIPAGMLIPGTTRVQVMAKLRRLGGSGAVGGAGVRLGNSGAAGINDNSIVAQSVAATANLDMLMWGYADVVTTTTYSGTGTAQPNSTGAAAAFVDRTTSFDTTASNLISIGIASTLTVDQVALLGYSITLLS